MLTDMETVRPDLILVQRLDRFGTADSNELGYFITLLKKQGVRLITVIDGKDRSKSDLETTLLNAVAASQSRQEQIDKAERVLVGKRRRAEDSRLSARIESFELAYRMQAQAPDAFDLTRETDRVQHLYGIDRKETETFGRQCLLARRLVERGVRFVQLYHTAGGFQPWDQHRE